MIQLVKSNEYARDLLSIHYIPQAAFDIVCQHQTLDADYIDAKGLCHEFSDLSLEAAELLQQDLVKAGFECKIMTPEEAQAATNEQLAGASS